jgi:hypothetical protein
MFPDDSDEDADNLDDAALLEAFLRPEHAAKPNDAEASVPDWPPTDATDRILRIDPATLNWFKAHHANWSREIGLVLRAWIASQTDATSASDHERHAPTGS